MGVTVSNDTVGVTVANNAVDVTFVINVVDITAVAPLLTRWDWGSKMHFGQCLLNCGTPVLSVSTMHMIQCTSTAPLVRTPIFAPRFTRF